MRKLYLEAFPELRDIYVNWERYMAYVVQRTLDERLREKYQRLRARKKGRTGRVVA